MATLPTTTERPATRLSPGARRAIVASTLGTLIEWYDYALYGVAAGLVIGPLFFPDATGAEATLLAFATFMVGFVVRPIGGLVIAHLGDTIGRKPALILTIVLMGIATTGIGLLPTADQIGIWATVGLVVLRALQGFGAGAELSGALTVAAEYTPAKRRGFYTGIINGVGAAGSTVAMLAFLAVSALPEEALLGWAWRIPFLFSAVLFVLALYIRRKLEETPEYQHAKNTGGSESTPRAPLKKVFKSDPIRALLAVLLWTGHNANLYIVLTFSLGFLTNTVELPRVQALTITLVASLAGCLLSPWWGAVGDRYGHIRVYAAVMTFGAVFALPLFWMLGSGSPVLAFVGLLLASAITMGGTSGTAGALTTSLFPTEFRFSGVAAAKEINAAAIAGPTPFIATALIAAAGGSTWLAAVFIGTCCAVTVLSLVFLGRRVTPEQADA